MKNITIAGNTITIDDGTSDLVVLNGGLIADVHALGSKALVNNGTAGWSQADLMAVEIAMNDGRREKIVLNSVDNQPGWVNTLAGRDQAISDLRAAMVV